MVVFLSFTVIFVTVLSANTDKVRGYGISDQIVSLADNSNYNVRLDGAISSDYFAYGSLYGTVATGDINNDGTDDLIVGSPKADNNSRADSGSLYIFFSETIKDISGTGNNVDLANSNNYDIRIDGAAASQQLTLGSIAIGDLNNNGKNDLVIGARYASYGATNTGSVYIIFDSLLDTFTGANRIVDLNTAKNYNLRLDGAAANDYFGYSGITVSDVNHDGRNDLIAPSYMGDETYDSTAHADAGGIYIILNGIIEGLASPGATASLSSGSNYSLLFAGGVANAQLGYGGSKVGDLNNNGRSDLVFAAFQNTVGAYTKAGSMYVIYDSLLDSLLSSGGMVPLSHSGTYNLRFDGYATNMYLTQPGAFAIGDLNNDEKNDLTVGVSAIDGVGGIFVIFNDRFSDYSGTNNNISLSTSTSYNIKISGAITGSGLANSFIADLNNDGLNDLILLSRTTAYNGVSSGSVYVLYNSFFANTTEPGSTLNLANSNDFSLRYDGAGASYAMSYTSMGAATADLDGNGNELFLSTTSGDTSKTAPGALYIIKNPLQPISLATVSNYNNGTLAVSGTVSSGGSISAVSGVEYQLDSGAVGGSWHACTGSSSFSCSLSSLSEGSHTVYVRSYDERGIYTNQANYYTSSFTTDLTAPSGGISINAGATSTQSANVSLNLSATDSASGVSEMEISENQDFSSASWESYEIGKNWTFSSDAGEKVIYARFKDSVGNISATSSATIRLVAASSDGDSSTSTATSSSVASKVASSVTSSASVSSMATNEESNLYDLVINVTDENSQPVKGAAVTLYSDPKQTTTDDNGQAFFSDVEGGMHRVVISYNGQTTEKTIYVGGDSALGEAVKVDVQIGEEKSQNSSADNSSGWSKTTKILLTLSAILLLMAVLYFVYAAKKRSKKSSNTVDLPSKLG